MFISGGEPLTRADIVEVIKVFKRYIPCVCINTNSLLLTEQLLDEMIEAGLNYIQVSLDGVKETHDYMRGDGCYERVIDKLMLISNKNIKLHVSCCVSMLNIDQMYDFVDDLINNKKVKIDMLGFKRFIPKNQMAGKYNLGENGLKKLYENYVKIKKDFGTKTQIVVDFPQKNVFCADKVLETMKKYELSCAGCSAATGGPCIRADGEVSPCSLLYVHSGNIFMQTLDEIYKDDTFVNICSRKLSGKCGECTYKMICGGCRAAALALNGDYLSEDSECFI